MITETITDDHERPVKIKYDGELLILNDFMTSSIIPLTKPEAIQLRDFLNQLNLEGE